MKGFVTAGVLAVSAVPAMGQELAFDIGPVTACLASAGRGAECIGLAASACMAQPGGQATAAMGWCLEREFLWWDAELNAAYGDLMAAERAADSRFAAGGLSRAETLREMQRAWITFRDAACGYEMTRWGGGTGQGPALIGCAMTRTAEQALDLRGWQEEGR